jgi:hypothetical protein
LDILDRYITIPQAILLDGDGDLPTSVARLTKKVKKQKIFTENKKSPNVVEKGPYLFPYSTTKGANRE